MLIIGHRGACGYEPENTLISFEKAISLGVDMVELDLYQCKSGELVVIHDESPKRTMHGKGYVEDLTYSELKKLVGDKNQHIPTLEEVIDLVDKRVRINIELKGDGVAEEVGKVIDFYVKNKGWTYNDFIVSSEDRLEIANLKQYNEEILRGILIPWPVFSQTNKLAKLSPYFVGTRAWMINKGFIENAHNNGMNVFVWTVNDKRLYKKMKKIGVDGVFSDYPDKLV